MSETTAESMIESPGSPTLWTRAFVAVLITQIGIGFTNSAFLMVPKFLAAELGASPSAIGVVGAANGIAAVFALFAMGSIVDRFSRRWAFAGGALLLAASSLAFTLVDEVGVLATVLRGVQGLAFGVTFAAGSALAVDAAPQERLGQAIGLFGLSMLSMNALAPAAVEVMAERMGWEAAFGISALGAAVAAVLVFQIREKPRAPETDGNGGLAVLMRRPGQKRVALIMMIVGAACGSVFTFYQPFALELGMERLQSFFLGYTGAAMLARLGFGPYVDRVGTARVALVSLVAYAIVVGAMMSLHPGSLPYFGIAFGLAHGLFYPSYNATVVRTVAESQRGRMMSVFQGWFAIGFASGSIGLGFLADAAGYEAVFGSMGAVTLVAVALLATAPELRDYGWKGSEENVST